jgi:hypothetical protein
MLAATLRLWTLHPRYLDTRGLVALWREGVLARQVLRGRTRGYRHHPQLERFRDCADPLRAIDAYLAEVHREAENRGHAFDASKIDARDPGLHRELARRVRPRTHPLFRVVPGGVSAWERAPRARRT